MMMVGPMMIQIRSFRTIRVAQARVASLAPAVRGGTAAPGRVMEMTEMMDLMGMMAEMMDLMGMMAEMMVTTVSDNENGRR